MAAVQIKAVEELLAHAGTAAARAALSTQLGVSSSQLTE